VSQKPRYVCENCRDSGVILTRGVLDKKGGTLYDDFRPCTACDGKSRLGGEVDEETKDLADALSGDTL
jgi:hypothetical protein